MPHEFFSLKMYQYEYTQRPLEREASPVYNLPSIQYLASNKNYIIESTTMTSNTLYTLAIILLFSPFHNLLGMMDAKKVPGALKECTVPELRKLAGQERSRETSLAAYLELGNRYFLGTGVAADRALALHYLQEAKNLQKQLPRGQVKTNTVSLSKMVRRAAKIGTSVQLKTLLDTHQIDIQAPNRKGSMLLHVASFAGNTAAVELLLERGALVDALDCNRMTPLHLAAQEGHGEIAAMLLDADAQREPLDIHGLTPAHYAAMQDHHELLELFIDADAHRCTMADGTTILHLAASRSQPETVALLIDQGGADVNAPTQKGVTPLAIAFRYKNDGAVRVLLEHNASMPSAEEAVEHPPRPETPFEAFDQ